MRFPYFFLFYILISSTIAAQTTTVLIDSLLAELPESSVSSLTIFNPNTNKTIYTHNEKKGMIPASNLKLFTSAAALFFFSEDHEFSTRIFSDDSDLTDSTIDGNLYIKGFGNSQFTEFDLDSLAENIKLMGVKKITGNIIGDDSYFDDNYNRTEWIVEEHSNVAVPPVSALALDRNMITLRFLANGEYRSKLICEVYPDLEFIQLTNEARVTKFKSNPDITSNFSNENIEIHVGGGMKKRRYAKRYSIYVANPALFSAFALFDRLKKNGVEILGKPVRDTLGLFSVEIEKSTVPLSSLLAKMNQESDNFTAECLFKSLGAYYSGKQGNSFYATQAVMTFLEEAGIPFDSLSLVDGSGISKYNRCSSSEVAGLLNYMYFNQKLFDTFDQSLSISGVSGTLKNRMINSAAEGNFRGKTGTLNGVSSISGYLTCAGGNEFIISILMEYKKKNGAFHKKVQDKIIELISEVY